MRKNVFDEGIITNSHFRSLSREAQLLYFHLSPDSMGLVANAITIIDSLGLTRNEMRELVARNFYIDLGDDIYLQKHWHINNNLDYRRLSTRFPEKMVGVFIKENRAYTLNEKEKDAKLTRIYLGKHLVSAIPYAQSNFFDEGDEEANELSEDKIAAIIGVKWVK